MGPILRVHAHVDYSGLRALLPFATKEAPPMRAFWSVFGWRSGLLQRHGSVLAGSKRFDSESRACEWET